MAIQAALARLRRKGLDDLPTDDTFVQLCHDAGHRWRDRLLTPLLTLKLMVLQIAWGNTAITHLRHLSGLAFAAGSYCDARMRLPLAAIQQLLGTLVDLAGGSAEPIKRGFRVLVADGTGFSMPDTPELRQHFGVPPRQKPGVGYPVCKLMGILDLASGMLIHALAMPLFTHDMKGIAQLHPMLRSGDVLVGDRAFCSVTHLMMLGLRKVHAVFRLHQRRPIQRRGGIVRWQRPEKCPVWLDPRMFETLPTHIELRLMRHVIARKGYRTRVLWLASTLPMTWSDEEVIDLYRRRWEIETCFGCLKTGMKMNVLKCRSVDGVMKELTIYLLVYNLARLIMLAWAQQMQVDVRRISFIDACRMLSCWLTGLSGCGELVVNPDRVGRVQLRRVRRRPKKYTLLTAPRHMYKLPEKPPKNA
jgi:putative transposase